MRVSLKNYTLGLSTLCIAIICSFLVIHELAYKSKEIYEKATIEEKRLLFAQIFTNIVQDGLRIKPNYTLAAEYLATWSPKLNSDYEREKTLITKAKTGEKLPVSTVWCLYCTKLEPIFKTNDVARAERVVALT